MTLTPLTGEVEAVKDGIAARGDVLPSPLFFRGTGAEAFVLNVSEK